jgi:hypothetical protein
MCGQGYLTPVKSDRKEMAGLVYFAAAAHKGAELRDIALIFE